MNSESGESMRRTRKALLKAALALPILALLHACGGDATLGGGGPGGGFLPPGNGGPGNGDDNGDVTTVRVGRIVNGSFEEGVMNVALSPVSSGGTTGLRIDLVDEDGALVAVDATATFDSPCIERNESTVSPEIANAVNGRINASYTVASCTGSDTVTATVNIDGDLLTAQGTVTIEPPVLGSAIFVSAEPNTIAMQGTGTTIPQSSLLTFRVTDASGAPVRDREVTFSLETQPGSGVTLVDTSGITNPAGEVTTRVSSGSQPTVVRVRMEVTDPTNGQTLSTLSEVLNVSTGLPTSRRLSLSASRLNIAGLNCDGEETTLNMRMSDRYGNPVPEGTAVQFGASLGGQIVGQCIAGNPLGDPLEESGVCSVLMTAQGTRPDSGRVIVLARVAGEIGFDDQNGNGFFDAGEPFDTVSEPFFDTASDGRDLPTNENGVWDAGEEFIDTTGDNTFNPDASGGTFVGYRCDAPGVNCSTQTLDIWESTVIVLSDSSPLVEGFAIVPLGDYPNACPDVDICIGAPGAFDAASRTVTLESENATVNFRVRIRDLNDNPLPEGTTVSADTEVGAMRAPDTQTQGNSNARGGRFFNFSIRGPDGTDPDAGVVTVTTSTPAESACGSVNTTLTLFSLIYSPPAPPVDGS